MTMEEYILKRLGLTATNDMLAFLIPRVKGYVMKYCGVEEMPEALEVICGNMVCALYQAAMGDTETVEQIKMGNVSVKFFDKEADVYHQYKLVLGLYRKGLFG